MPDWPSHEFPMPLAWFLSRIMPDWPSHSQVFGIILEESCQTDHLACKNYSRFWHDSCQDSCEGTLLVSSYKNYPKFWHESCQGTLLVSCFQELLKLLTWFFSRDLVSILLSRITKDSDMILVKDVVVWFLSRDLFSILLVSITQGTGLILPKDLVKGPC